MQLPDETGPTHCLHRDCSMPGWVNWSLWPPSTYDTSLQCVAEGYANCILLHPAVTPPPPAPFVSSSGAYKNSMVWCCVNKLWSDVVSKNVKTIENLYFTFCPIFIKDLRWVTKTITCCLRRCVRRTHFEMSATPTITFCQRKWREMKCQLTSYLLVMLFDWVKWELQRKKQKHPLLFSWLSHNY